MSLAESAIGILAPPSCEICGNEGSLLCTACSESEILPYGSRCWRCGSLTTNARTCKSCRLDSPRHIWITTDYEGVAKQVIYKYKFDHLRIAAMTLAKLMQSTFLNYNSDEDITRRDYLVVPIPTATSRIRERSFGHAELLAKNFSCLLHMKYKNGLGRLGQIQQRGSRREARLQQTLGQYYVKSPKAVAGRNILLIDDVITTGATLKSAYKILRKAGAARIDGLVFAKKL